MVAELDVAPGQAQSFAEVLAAWGLPVGRVTLGWTVASAGSVPGAGRLVLRREGHEVEVWLRRASGEACFARVGQIDVTHGPVDPRVEREVGELLRAFCAFLSRHREGAALLPLLEAKAGLPREEAHAALSGETPATAAPPPEAYDAGEAPPLDPARRTPEHRPFMRFETITLDEVVRYPDAIREMYAGTLGGLVIQGVYDKAFMAQVIERLTGDAVAYPRHSFPARFKAHFYGRCLDGSDPALEEYLADAARFRDETLATFAGGVPFEARMEQMFGALAGGRSVSVPRFTDGRPYTPATIRILLEGGQIGTHCGNEASTRPAYTHLNEVIDRADQISYFLTLQAPLAGGELIVYSLKWSDIDASRIVGGRSQVDDLLREAEWMAVSPAAGDLLLFDGGRYFHRVSHVAGERIRWTMGGFMMFDRGGRNLYYWS